VTGMRTRTGRFILLAFLLIVGVIATVFSASLARQIASLGRSSHALNQRVDQLLLTIQQIEAAQLAYVAVNTTDHQATEQPLEMIARIRSEAAELERTVQSPQSSEALKTLSERTEALEEFESQAREHLRLGQDLMAANVISVEARQALSAMTGALRELRAAEDAAIDQDRVNVLRQVWSIVAGSAAVWLLGLVALVGIPRTRTPLIEPTTAPAILSIDEHPRVDAPSMPSLNLARAADICTAVNRITDADDLKALLTQAAAAIDASSIVLWMAAGEQLIAASAYGYDSTALARLGPIHRAALNATAAAWRQHRLQVVDGRDGGHGAVVTPLIGTERCVGVLAAEVPNGRESDTTTQAVTRFLAAQLAATLAPWPAPSVADAHVTPLDKVAEA